MSNEENLTLEEIKSLRSLLDIEKIKELRFRYSYHMDSRDLDKLMDVSAEGAICGYGPYGDWVGKEVIYNNYKEICKGKEAAFTKCRIITNQSTRRFHKR